jgi:hypothetical protein
MANSYNIYQNVEGRDEFLLVIYFDEAPYGEDQGFHMEYCDSIETAHEVAQDQYGLTEDDYGRGQ